MSSQGNSKKKNPASSSAAKSDRVAYALVDDKKRTAAPPKGAANAKPADDREVDVLYQRMGDRWYAFSLIDDDLFFSEVPDGAPGAGKKPSA